MTETITLDEIDELAVSAFEGHVVRKDLAQQSMGLPLISGGKATVAHMFVNNVTGQRGLVAQYDGVCFDEVSGVIGQAVPRCGGGDLPCVVTGRP